LHDALAPLGEEFASTILSADHVMASLFKSAPNRTSPCWLLTELIHLFNLAITVKSIAQAPDSLGMEDGIQKLDGMMPAPFLKDLTIAEDGPYIVGYSKLVDVTFDASLAIRLQSVVLQIQQNFENDDFDLEDLIRETLRMGGTDNNLRAWDVNGLGDGNLGLLPEYHKKMERWIRRIQSAVRDDLLDIEDGSEEGLQILAKNFPWSDFRATVLRWAKLRMEEIVGAVKENGGPEQLMNELRHELSKDASFDPKYVLPQTRTPVKKRNAGYVSFCASWRIS
jgi:hypothetical protein